MHDLAVRGSGRRSVGLVVLGLGVAEFGECRGVARLAGQSAGLQVSGIGQPPPCLPGLLVARELSEPLLTVTA